MARVTKSSTEDPNPKSKQEFLDDAKDRFFDAMKSKVNPEVMSQYVMMAQTEMAAESQIGVHGKNIRVTDFYPTTDNQYAAAPTPQSLENMKYGYTAAAYAQQTQEPDASQSQAALDYQQQQYQGGAYPSYDQQYAYQQGYTAEGYDQNSYAYYGYYGYGYDTTGTTTQTAAEGNSASTFASAHAVAESPEAPTLTPAAAKRKLEDETASASKQAKVETAPTAGGKGQPKKQEEKQEEEEGGSKGSKNVTGLSLVSGYASDDEE